MRSRRAMHFQEILTGEGPSPAQCSKSCGPLSLTVATSKRGWASSGAIERAAMIKGLLRVSVLLGGGPIPQTDGGDRYGAGEVVDGLIGFEDHLRFVEHRTVYRILREAGEIAEHEIPLGRRGDEDRIEEGRIVPHALKERIVAVARGNVLQVHPEAGGRVFQRRAGQADGGFGGVDLGDASSQIREVNVAVQRGDGVRAF